MLHGVVELEQAPRPREDALGAEEQHRVALEQACRAERVSVGLGTSTATPAVATRHPPRARLALLPPAGQR